MTAPSSSSSTARACGLWNASGSTSWTSTSRKGRSSSGPARARRTATSLSPAGLARPSGLPAARPARLLAERWDDGSLFLSRYGRRLGPMSVRTTVKRCGAKVGVKLSTHVLRHSCATHLIKGGADVRHVQKLLGHKDISTTTLYTKVDTTSLGGMLRRCHPRER